MKTTILTFLFLLLCLKVFAFSQKPIQFRTLNLKNGLPSNTVNDLFIDQKGFIWLSTTNGLCRYDGIRVKVFHPEKDNLHAISHANVLGVCQDSRPSLHKQGKCLTINSLKIALMY